MKSYPYKTMDYSKPLDYSNPPYPDYPIRDKQQQCVHGNTAGYGCTYCDTDAKCCKYKKPRFAHCVNHNECMSYNCDNGFCLTPKYSLSGDKTSRQKLYCGDCSIYSDSPITFGP